MDRASSKKIALPIEFNYQATSVGYYTHGCYTHLIMAYVNNKARTPLN